MKPRFMSAIAANFMVLTAGASLAASDASEKERAEQAERDCEEFSSTLDYSQLQGLLKNAGVRKPAPYPDVSRLENYACVATQMDINEQGLPTNITVVFAAPEDLDEQFAEISINAASNWRYEWITVPNPDAAKGITVMHSFILED